VNSYVPQCAFETGKGFTVWRSPPCWLIRGKNRGGVPENRTEAISPIPSPGKF
jgi:hypothetical protein